MLLPHWPILSFGLRRMPLAAYNSATCKRRLPARRTWEVTLAGTELARAQVSTIRLKLLKIGAVVLRNTRKVRLLLASSYPYQAILSQVVKALGSG
jgi:Transposase DDE domain group 1